MNRVVGLTRHTEVILIMKRTMTIALVLLVVLAAWGFGQAQPRLAPFRITIEPSATGAKLTCVTGCEWKTASYFCLDTPCRFEVDQKGVGPDSVK